MSVLLLTGPPGSGKTTALRRAAERLRGRRLGGFYTEEIRRRGGERMGFRAVTFDGVSADLARVDRPGPPRVGRYGVDVAVMDALAARLVPAAPVDVWLVDEIGTMECLSRAFVTAMRTLLEAPTRCLRGSWSGSSGPRSRPGPSAPRGGARRPRSRRRRAPRRHARRGG